MATLPTSSHSNQHEETKALLLYNEHNSSQPLCPNNNYDDNLDYNSLSLKIFSIDYYGIDRSSR
jgi:hypothetical protein